MSDDEVAVTRPARKRAAKAPQFTSESSNPVDSPPSVSTPPESPPVKTRSRKPTAGAATTLEAPVAVKAPVAVSEAAPVPGKSARVTRARKAAPAADLSLSEHPTPIPTPGIVAAVSASETANSRPLRRIARRPAAAIVAPTRPDPAMTSTVAKLATLPSAPQPLVAEATSAPEPIVAATSTPAPAVRPAPRRARSSVKQAAPIEAERSTPAEHGQTSAVADGFGTAPALAASAAAVAPVTAPTMVAEPAVTPNTSASSDQAAAYAARPRTGSHPVTFRPQNGQAPRGPGGQPRQPFVPRGQQGTPTQGQAPNDGQGDVRGRRRRRRRGRGVPGGVVTPVGAATPIAPPPPAPTYEERPQPHEFIPAPRMPVFEVQGILDGLPNGEAFLREDNLRVRADDPLVSVRDMRRFDLRNGDGVVMEARPGRGRGPVLVERVVSINDEPYDEHKKRPRFEDLTPVYPDRMIKLETGQLPLTTRMLDMIAPVGFGQRALIVSPPKAGKTTILKHIGQGVITNYPDAKLILCLVGERPEEVTDLRNSLPQAIMFASSFDEEVERHGHLAEMALERAKRLAEQGKDVIVLLDSVTRLARAYNLGPGSGGSRTLSGGMDANALTTARRIFGAARAIEQGGSLTIIATCLIDTGSRLDEVVYEEFKGTGNMELHLDRGLSEKRIFPAIDITRSSTRKEELLLDPSTLQWVVLLRRRLASTQSGPATEQFIDRLSKTPSNKVFLELLSRAQS